MKQTDKLTVRTYGAQSKSDRPGPNSAGQSGDDMGLPRDEVAGSESVAELAEEGQYFEADAVSGLERPYPGDREVRTRQVSEEDVPTEYPAKDSGLDTD
jgi:hypothetical protein